MASKTPEPVKKVDFEKSLTRLEEVVRKLESPQLSLEEAEGRVEILLKKADGKLTTEPFAPETENKR